MNRVRLVGLLVALLLTAAQPVSGAVGQQIEPQTAPCVTATMRALDKRGYPYVWGAKGPNSFDCSGLTYWSYSQAGIDIGPSTYDQAYAGVAISCTLSHLHGSTTTCWSPGDLIFLQYSGGQHVAIYAGDGLFMDCYSPAVGCVLHAVQLDSFYVANFWQARRITSGCEGMTIDPGTPIADPPSQIESPGIESIPDVVDYVSFSLPDPAAWWPEQAAPTPGDGGIIGSLLYGLRWLGWFLSMTLRDLLTFVFWLAQHAANFAALAINAVLTVINALWRLGVVTWLGAKAMFLGIWLMAEDIRAWIYSLSAWLAYPRAWLVALLAVLELVLAVIVSGLELIMGIGQSVLGLLGWIGGLVITTMVEIMRIINGEAVTSSNVPEPLQPVQAQADLRLYEIVRGMLTGLIASQIGWLIYLVWAMVYVAFFFWVARYLSSSREAS